MESNLHSRSDVIRRPIRRGGYAAARCFISNKMSRNTDVRIPEVCKNRIEEKFNWIPNKNIFSLSPSEWLSAPIFRCFGIELDFRIGRELGFNVCTLRALGTAEIVASVHVTIGYRRNGCMKDEVICRDRSFTKRDENWFLLNVIESSVVGNWRGTSDDAKLTLTVVRNDLHLIRNSLLQWDKVEELILETAYGISIEKRTNSRDTQTENTPDTDGRIDLPAQLDMEDVSLLREHFKDLLLSGDDHDVIITVKDKEFKAHKCVLRARSPVFEAMFRNKMKESADGTVSIDDCDPEVFGKFLRYVYTGKWDFESASHAVGLFYVGDKYDLPRLKQNCIAFLKVSLSTTTISDVITLAARHGEEELLQQGIVYFSKHMEEIMLTVEWQRFHASNPTEANEMCLKAVQCLKAYYTSKK